MSDLTAFESKGHTEHHVCFCGPCSKRVAELEAESARFTEIRDLVERWEESPIEVDAIWRWRMKSLKKLLPGTEE